MTDRLLSTITRNFALPAFAMMLPFASAQGQANRFSAAITSTGLLAGITDTRPPSPVDVLPPDFRGTITYQGPYQTALMNIQPGDRTAYTAYGAGSYTVVMSIDGRQISGTVDVGKLSNPQGFQPGSGSFTGTRDGAVCRVNVGGFITIAYCGRSLYRENARIEDGRSVRFAVIANAASLTPLVTRQAVAQLPSQKDSCSSMTIPCTEHTLPSFPPQNSDALPPDFRGQITYDGFYKGKAYPLVKLLSVPGAGDYRVTMEIKGSQVSGSVSASSSLTGDKFSLDPDSFIGSRSGTSCHFQWRSGGENDVFCGKTALRFNSKEKVTNKPGWTLEYTVDTQAREIVDYVERDRQQTLAAARDAQQREKDRILDLVKSKAEEKDRFARVKRAERVSLLWKSIQEIRENCKYDYKGKAELDYQSFLNFLNDNHQILYNGVDNLSDEDILRLDPNNKKGIILGDKWINRWKDCKI